MLNNIEYIYLYNNRITIKVNLSNQGTQSKGSLNSQRCNFKKVALLEKESFLAEDFISSIFCRKVFLFSMECDETNIHTL